MAVEPTDYLRLGQSPAVHKLLSSFSAGNERVKFSDQVEKINRKSQKQKRVLLVTDRGIYNLEKSKCKRRIDFKEVAKIIFSNTEGQFVIHVPTEYDYHYKTPRQMEVVALLQQQIKQTLGTDIECQGVDAPDLSPYVVTKNDSKKERKATFSFFGGSSKSSGGEDPSAGMANLSVADRERSPTVMHYASKDSGEKTTVELEDFDLLKVIGKGSFGKVMQVRMKSTGEILAMKVLHKDAVLQKKQVEHTKAERDILQQVQHPFLVGLRYAFQNESKLYMVLDYLNGGELFFHLKNARKFDENRSRIYSAELILALGHLHSLGIVYRDLKPENILLDREGHIRITDFGLAKHNIHDNASAQTFCGTPEYLAPEILSSTGHGRAVDWWSLGTLIFEMLTGLPPYYDSNLNVMYRKILQDPLVFPSCVSATARDMLTKLLDRNPDTRLGSGPSDGDEIKAHKWFDSINWQKLFNKEIPAPFKPDVRDEASTDNFDSCFTDEAAQDSYVDESRLAVAKNANFDGFTFVDKSALS